MISIVSAAEICQGPGRPKTDYWRNRHALMGFIQDAQSNAELMALVGWAFGLSNPWGALAVAGTRQQLAAAAVYTIAQKQADPPRAWLLSTLVRWRRRQFNLDYLQGYLRLNWRHLVSWLRTWWEQFLAVVTRFCCFLDHARKEEATNSNPLQPINWLAATFKHRKLPLPGKIVFRLKNGGHKERSILKALERWPYKGETEELWWLVSRWVDGGDRRILRDVMEEAEREGQWREPQYDADPDEVRREEEMYEKANMMQGELERTLGLNPIAAFDEALRRLRRGEA